MICMLLLADGFENCRKMCLEICLVQKLDPVNFFSVPGLAWKAAFKKTNVKPEQLKDNDMSLMVEKGIRWEICHSKNRYAKPNNKYMKDFDKK